MESKKEIEDTILEGSEGKSREKRHLFRTRRMGDRMADGEIENSGQADINRFREIQHGVKIIIDE